jgi:hypothetical protein
MDFSPTEIKTIERLRRQQRRWPTARWLLLLMGAFLLLCCSILLSKEINDFHEHSRVINVVASLIGKLPSDQIGKQLVEIDDSRRNQLVEVVIFLPIWLLVAIFAIYLITTALVNWRGHVEGLLLKLLDDQSKQGGH